jgi:hypothetical protein
MHYNATLCKEAWGKKFAHGVLTCFLKEFAVAGGRSGESCEAYVFFLKTVPVIFFGALAKEWHLKCKSFYLKPNEKMYSRYWK